MNVILLNTTTSKAFNQIVTIIFIDQCTWRRNSSLWELVCRVFRVLLKPKHLSIPPMLYFSVDATNSRKVMTRCVNFVTISSSISFGQPLSAVNIQQYTILPQLAFSYFFTPESTLTHTIPIAVSALLNILQHKALIRTLFLSSSCTKTRCQTGFASPMMLLCPMAMDSFVVLRAVM